MSDYSGIRVVVFNATFNYAVYDQFSWWRKYEYPEKTTDLPQVTEERLSNFTLRHKLT